MHQVLVFDKFLIRNLFEEEFEQGFRKRIDIVTDVDLILVKEYEFTDFLATPLKFTDSVHIVQLLGCKGLPNMVYRCSGIILLTIPNLRFFLFHPLLQWRHDGFQHIV